MMPVRLMRDGVATAVRGPTPRLEQVWDALAEPDAEMLDAGAAELALALGPGHGHTPATRRALCRVMWRAMIDRARYFG